MFSAEGNRSSMSFIAVMRYCLLLFLWSGFVGTPAHGDPAPILKEYQIKAAFLYNFCKYVEWPGNGTSANAGSDPFVIAILGKNPFGQDLESIVKGRSIDNRPIRIVYVSDPNRLEFCHILFVSASEEKVAEKVLPQLAFKPVLTVGESDGFKKAGGIVAFVVEGDRVRFDIEASAAQKAGLKISAQLQKLARNSK